MFKGPWILIHRNEPHIGHHHHLCDMITRGDVTLNQIKSLVRGAKFICVKCGRIAAEEKNLCEPRLL